MKGWKGGKLLVRETQLLCLIFRVAETVLSDIAHISSLDSNNNPVRLVLFFLFVCVRKFKYFSKMKQLIEVCVKVKV